MDTAWVVCPVLVGRDAELDRLVAAVSKTPAAHLKLVDQEVFHDPEHLSKITLPMADTTATEITSADQANP